MEEKGRGVPPFLRSFFSATEGPEKRDVDLAKGEGYLVKQLAKDGLKPFARVLHHVFPGKKSGNRRKEGKKGKETETDVRSPHAHRSNQEERISVTAGKEPPGREKLPALD